MLTVAGIKFKINYMKKKERNALEEKLLAGIKKVIMANKADLTIKTEKIIKQVLRKIAKKIKKEKATAPKK